MKTPIIVVNMEAETAHFVPEPFASQLGLYEGRDVGKHFDLTQLGAHVETLFPGAQSALRHWHSHSDELVYVIEGELTLTTDESEFILEKGMTVGFKAGVANGHHLVNRSLNNATFLVVGSRSPADKVHYPDDDLQWLNEDGKWYPARKNGIKY